MKKVFYSVFLVAVGFSAGYFKGKLSSDIGFRPSREVVLCRDTIFVESPRPIEARSLGELPRRLPVAVQASGGDSLCCRSLVVADSTVVCDSVDVAVPIVAKIYSDSTFRAVVSGFEPSLDTLVIYPRRAIAGRKPCRWGVGVTAGVNMSSRGISPGISVGLTYTFATF